MGEKATFSNKNNSILPENITPDSNFHKEKNTSIQPTKIQDKVNIFLKKTFEEIMKENKLDDPRNKKMYKTPFIFLILSIFILMINIIIKKICKH